MDMNKRGDSQWRVEGDKGINWDNCNSTINFKKRKEEKHISLKTEKKK